MALMEIRDKRLYRVVYSSFEAYCADRWNMSKPHAHRLIASVGVIDNLVPLGTALPVAEPLTRPLRKLEPEQQREVWQELMQNHVNGEVTERHVEAAVKAVQRVNIQLEREAMPEPPPAITPALPIGKYRCIVIDPPWPMEKIDRTERPNQSHYLDYPVMSIEEIAALPVADFAIEGGCHLYLWTTQKFLPDALDLMEHWGFNYQCVMTWVKPTGMTPYSWMYNTELVLFGRMGNLQLERMGLKLSFEAPVIGHSIKPDVFYERVLQASPEPRLEMFSRRERDGFEAWGNEV